MDFDNTQRAQLSEACLDSFVRENHRSVIVEIQTAHGNWGGNRFANLKMPAASILKIPLAMAIEQEVKVKNLDWQQQIPLTTLLSDQSSKSILRALDDTRFMSLKEVTKLMLVASDELCARFLLQQVSVAQVRTVLDAVGCIGTSVEYGQPDSTTALSGFTTGQDALALIKLGMHDQQSLVASALASSISNSRVPLGVRKSDIKIAHKTGTLHGVAHDVGVIRGSSGVMYFAFLSDKQHDTLVTGYEMGICVQELLRIWEFNVASSTGLD